MHSSPVLVAVVASEDGVQLRLQGRILLLRASHCGLLMQLNASGCCNARIRHRQPQALATQLALVVRCRCPGSAASQ